MGRIIRQSKHHVLLVISKKAEKQFSISVSFNGFIGKQNALIVTTWFSPFLPGCGHVRAHDFFDYVPSIEYALLYILCMENVPLDTWPRRTARRVHIGCRRTRWFVFNFQPTSRESILIACRKQENTPHTVSLNINAVEHGALGWRWSRNNMYRV